jgi:sRNA-binding carbon storage regulator CsrA
MGLVLQRCVGQKIVIDRDIVLTVTKIERRSDGKDRVYFCIEAPRTITIDRLEVDLKKRQRSG